MTITIDQQEKSVGDGTKIYDILFEGDGTRALEEIIAPPGAGREFIIQTGSIGAVLAGAATTWIFGAKRLVGIDNVGTGNPSTLTLDADGGLTNGQTTTGIIRNTVTTPEIVTGHIVTGTGTSTQVTIPINVTSGGAQGAEAQIALDVVGVNCVYNSLTGQTVSAAVDDSHEPLVGGGRRLGENRGLYIATLATGQRVAGRVVITDRKLSA